MSLGPTGCCPDCGHDPTGDDEEFRSGGGWFRDTSIEGSATGSVHVTEWRCPICRTVVDRQEKEHSL